MAERPDADKSRVNEEVRVPDQNAAGDEREALAAALHLAYPTRHSTHERDLLAAATILAALHRAGYEVRRREGPVGTPPGPLATTSVRRRR